MRWITTAIAAAFVLAGAGSLDAQDRNDRPWWEPALIVLAQQGGLDALPWEDGRARDRGRWDDDDRWDDDEDRWEDEDERWEERRERWEDDDDRWEDEDERWEERRERWEDDDGRRRGRGERWENRRERRGGGPPFCRNGRGHPVHGMGWCREKGWDRGGYDRYGDWSRAGWTDVILGSPERRRDRRLREPSLLDVLGDVVFGRLVERGSRSGMDGPLDGRWLRTDRGSILQVRMGGMPLAEMADVDRDGRADVVLLNRR